MEQDVDPTEELIMREVRRREEELQALEELRRESCYATGFTPRRPLARTPPSRFSSGQVSSEPETTATTTATAAAKRMLSSPEEVQEAVRRRVQARRAQEEDREERTQQALPPTPAATEGDLDVEEDATPTRLASMATNHTKGIMEAVRAKSSKLNKDEIAAIACHTERLSAIITHLVVRLAAQKTAPVQPAHTPAAMMGPPMAPYAAALKLGKKSQPVPIPPCPGPTVAIYPAEDQKEIIKTAEDTKKVLRSAMDPSSLKVQIHGVRKVGNAGVVIQTTSERAAEKVRKALPATLRAATTVARRPVMSLAGFDINTGYEDMVVKMKDQNFEEDPRWTPESIKSNIKKMYQRTWRTGGRCTWICEVSPEMRQDLLKLDSVYIGWDLIEVQDYVGVTCCNRCQQMGHPEKYCRAKTMTCGRCGEDGHKHTECEASAQCCATCKKLKQKGAALHKTNARECPARQHAEERAIQAINYG